MIVAHRGFKSKHGENRFIEFERALNFCKGVEIDIQLTKDDIPVVFHDNRFLRIGRSLKKVHQVNYEDISKMRWFSKHPEWVPAKLDSFMEEYGEKFNHINIEIKNMSSKSNKLDWLIKKIINYKNDNVLISSFDDKVINRLVSKYKGQVKIGYLVEKMSDIDINIVKDVTFVNPPRHLILNELYIDSFKKIGKPINVWAVKKSDDAKKIYKIYGEQLLSFITDNETLKWR